MEMLLVATHFLSPSGRETRFSGSCTGAPHDSKQRPLNVYPRESELFLGPTSLHQGESRGLGWGQVLGPQTTETGLGNAGPRVARRTPYLGRVKHHTGDFLGMAFEGGQDLLRTLVEDDDIFIRPTWKGPTGDPKTSQVLPGPSTEGGTFVPRPTHRTGA